MKILLLTDGLFPILIGGMQKHSFLLGKYLLRQGHELSIAHIIKQGADKNPYHGHLKDEELSRLTIEAFPFRNTDPFPGHYVRSSKAYSKGLFAHYQESLTDYDVIYAQGFTGYHFIRNKQEDHPPIISNLHGYEMFQQVEGPLSYLKQLLLRPIARYINSQSDYIACFAGKIKQIALEQGAKEDRLLVLHNAIESDWISEQIKISPYYPKRSFLFVGRYERRKGIEELNEVLKSIDKDYADKMVFGFVGDIPKSKQLYLPNVSYHGRISDPEDMKRLMSDYEVLVLPSHSEGMPTVILEAMSRGLAMLATDVGAVAKMINQNGWLIENPQKAALSAAIKEAIDTEELQLLQMRQRSIELVMANFTWSKNVERLNALLNEKMNK